MAKAVVTFATYRGGQLISRDSVTHDIVKVGRDPKSHLRVDDEAASRMHAVIEVAGPGEITLIDLGNDPGTYVNGERINKCRLRVGDRIDIGSTQLVLESVEPEGAGAGRFEARQALGAAVRANTTQQGLDPVHANAQEQFWSGGYPAQEAAAQAQHAAFAAPAHVAQAVPAPAAFGHGGASHGHGHARGHGGGGNYTYAMVKSGPDVSPDEVELPHVQAAEVMILWGTNVLHVAHLAPPRNFYVGEEQTKAFTSDFFIPS